MFIGTTRGCDWPALLSFPCLRVRQIKIQLTDEGEQKCASQSDLIKQVMQPKKRVAAKLIEAGHQLTDAASALQPHGSDDCAEQVAMLVLRHNAERGIIITSRVVGASVAANRVPGIRAAACHDAYSAAVGARAEGMNVLVLALHSLEPHQAQEVVDAYLGATLAPVEVVGGLPPRRLQRVFSHVRENIAQELAVSELARIVGMSQYYFSKLFKLSTGHHASPIRYAAEGRARPGIIARGPNSVGPGRHPCGFRDPEPLYQCLSPALGDHSQALSRTSPQRYADRHVGTGNGPAEVSDRSIAGQTG